MSFLLSNGMNIQTPGVLACSYWLVATRKFCADTNCLLAISKCLILVVRIWYLLYTKIVDWFPCHDAVHSQQYTTLLWKQSTVIKGHQHWPSWHRAISDHAPISDHEPNPQTAEPSPLHEPEEAPEFWLTYFHDCWLLLVVVGCCWFLLIFAGVCWLLLVFAGCCWLLIATYIVHPSQSRLWPLLSYDHVSFRSVLLCCQCDMIHRVRLWL